MRRTRIIRILISTFGLMLGIWLSVGGLELRLFSAYGEWHQQIPLLHFPEHIFQLQNIIPANTPALGWPMVVFGSSWGGALIGFWIGERWSVPAMVLLAALGLPFPFLGTLLGFILLLLIFSAPEIKPGGRKVADEG